MKRFGVAIVIGLIAGFTGSAPGHDQPAPSTATVVADRDIAEKLDGKEAKVAVVELVLEPGQAGKPNRHNGPVFGYLLEGEYEWAINDRPAQVLKAGDTFYEPTGCMHRVSKNPGKVKARVLAMVLHPRDGKPITVPEPEKK